MSEAITAKARAIYGKRLTPEDYKNLMYKNSISGIVDYLKSTPRYRKAFANVNETQIHRGQVEQLLSKNVFELYLKLCRFMSADKNSFCSYLIREEEIKQIISALVYIKAGSKDGYLLEMPAYMMNYISFDMMKLSKAENYLQVLTVLEGTPYHKLLKPLLTLKEADLEECGVTLYGWFLSWAFKAIDRDYKGDEAKSLKDAFLRQSDLTNIMRCYRKRSLFNEDTEQIKRSLRDGHYRVSPAVIDEILARPDADVQLLALLKRLYFKDRIPFDKENLEIAIRRYNYSFCKKQLCFSQNGVMSLYALMGLCETERSNLQKIIEAARYNRPPSETEKFLVM
ncbi:MAG: V-type ATPase subunit [Firmicutes bacterium]|nr:V-type ATPase subunit [[Eubacterium] siraeum]MCM1487603.1 V-type ATPase subunit [Bacillota bacterium]